MPGEPHTAFSTLDEWAALGKVHVPTLGGCRDEDPYAEKPWKPRCVKSVEFLPQYSCTLKKCANDHKDNPTHLCHLCPCAKRYLQMSSLIPPLVDFDQGSPATSSKNVAASFNGKLERPAEPNQVPTAQGGRP